MAQEKPAIVHPDSMEEQIVIIESTVLRKYWGTISKFASRRSPKESMRCVQLKATNTLVQMSARKDGAACQLSFDVDQPLSFEVGLDSGKFGELIGKCFSDLIEIKPIKNKVRVVMGRTKADVLTSDYDEGLLSYAFGNEDTWSSHHQISAMQLLDAIKRISVISGAKEHSKYEGVHLELSPNGSSHVLATSGAMLGCVGVETFPQGPARSQTVSGSIPHQAALLLSSVLQVVGDEEVSVAIDDNMMYVSSGHMKFSANIIALKFPNWRQLVENDRRTTMFDVDFDDLNKSSSQCDVATDQEHLGIEFSFSRDKIDLRCFSPQFGQVESQLPVKQSNGESDMMTFNGSFVSKMLATVSGAKSVIISVADEKTPALFRGEHVTVLIAPIA